MQRNKWTYFHPVLNAMLKGMRRQLEQRLQLFGHFCDKESPEHSGCFCMYGTSSGPSLHIFFFLLWHVWYKGTMGNNYLVFVPGS